MAYTVPFALSYGVAMAVKNKGRGIQRSSEHYCELPPALALLLLLLHGFLCLYLRLYLRLSLCLCPLPFALCPLPFAFVVPSFLPSFLPSSLPSFPVVKGLPLAAAACTLRHCTQCRVSFLLCTTQPRHHHTCAHLGSLLLPPLIFTLHLHPTPQGLLPAPSN